MREVEREFRRCAIAQFYVSVILEKLFNNIGDKFAGTVIVETISMNVAGDRFKDAIGNALGTKSQRHASVGVACR